MNNAWASSWFQKMSTWFG